MERARINLSHQNQPTSPFKRARFVVGLLLISLATLLAACGGGGSDQSPHDADEHEEVTDLLVVKSREKGMALPEELSEQIKSFDHVVRVEKYIRLRMETFDVVGIELGEPQWIMTGQPDVHLIEADLAAGRELRAGDADTNSVLVGGVFSESVGATTGQTFGLADTDYELAVVGEFSTDPASLSSTILMPLSLVQKIYDKEGKVTHFWVSVDSPDKIHDVIRALQVELGESFEVLPRAHR